MNDDTETLQILARMPAMISELLSGVPPESIRVRLSPEEFSVVENICHLRDIEVEGYTVRIRRLLEEDNPQLDDIDGARLAVERDYNRQNLNSALETFTFARKKNVELLSVIKKDDWQRKGSMQGVGEIKLETLIEMMIEHDAGHLDELGRSARLLRSSNASASS
jgi:hypothetical protein